MAGDSRCSPTGHAPKLRFQSPNGKRVRRSRLTRSPSFLARLAGSKPTTLGSVAKYSIQLSYSREAPQYSLALRESPRRSSLQREARGVHAMGSACRPFLLAIAARASQARRRARRATRRHPPPTRAFAATAPELTLEQCLPSAQARCPSRGRGCAAFQALNPVRPDPTRAGIKASDRVCAHRAAG